MTRDDLKKFSRIRVLVIGDVMLDHFIWGSVRRISPEAPVPVVEVTKETWYPGGAANVARNVAPFSRHVAIMGRVGADSSAEQLRVLLAKEGVDCNPLLVSKNIPTISKARIIARQQQVVRVDREVRQTLASSELREVEKKLRALGGKLDAIIIEDYGKGFVTAELLEAVASFSKKFNVLVAVDPSSSNLLSWHGAHLVKPNRAEAFAAAGVPDTHLAVPPGKNPELAKVGTVLLGRWNVPSVLITLGEQGMMLFQRGKKPHHIPTRAREVFDVSGAGDTAIALLTVALAAGMTSELAADVANHASGIVVGKLGTATLTPDELLNAFTVSQTP